MENRAPYWRHITLTSGGKIKQLAQPEARAFIHRLEAKLNPDPKSDRALQGDLIAIYGGASPEQALAEGCLRNFITYNLYQRCETLAHRFGRGKSNPHGPADQTPFTAVELFCCVFEAPLASVSASPDMDRDFYDPLTTKILTTFDPEKGGLATWCATCFRGSLAVKRFLRECGVVLETDWQLLCRLRIGKLQRLLAAADCAAAAVDSQVQLLTVFHQVYRTQLEEQRSATPSRRPYPPPTEPQLIEMGRRLSSPTPVDAPALLNRLKQLAQYVRQDRCRGASPPPKAPATVLDPAIEQLLEGYCQPCLEQAVEQTIDQRLAYLRQTRRGAAKADPFLYALTLFYCHSQPMKAIAAAVGLRDQPSVSRLLKREALQADIRRRVLACLLQRVGKLADANRSPDRLQSLDQQISAFLDPYVDRVIAADRREGYTSKHRQMTSAYAAQLCRCAAARRKSS